MNGVNLNQFQFEYDLTWMSFFQNGEGRTYIRYGGRDDDDPESYLTKESLARVMRQALVLDREGRVQPADRYEPVATSVRTPADIPTMQPMIARRKESCIHCHDVKVAELRHLRDRGKLEKDMIFTYPSPSNLGIQLDVDAQFVVERVTPDSPAAAAGLRTGDLIRAVGGHSVLTFADFTRVLELAPPNGSLPVTYQRGTKTATTELRLPQNWRRSDDPSWRPSTSVVGPNAGFWGRPANDKERRNLGVGPDDLAIRVTFIYRPWTRASGVKLNDFVVALDGNKSDMNMRQAHAHLQLNRDWGDEIDFTVRRGGKDVNLKMKFPNKPPD